MNTTDEQIKTLREPCRSGQWYCNGEWHIYNDWKASRERCPGRYFGKVKDRLPT